MSDYTQPTFCPRCDNPESLCVCVPMNQCDGCRAGLKLVDGVHRDGGGRAVMVCQSDRYTAAKEQP